MRKIYLFLLALICSVGAWAQTVVTSPKTSTVFAKYQYTLHCKATDHSSYLGIKDGAFNGRLAEEYATRFVFENGPADGQYYLKSLELGYVTANGGNITFTETPSTYWTFNRGEGWTYLLANGQNGVYLNNNKTTGDGIKTAAGTGDCSHWVLTEYEIPQLFTATCDRSRWSYNDGLKRAASKDAETDAEKFALVTYEGQKYLWNQSAEGFLKNNGKAATVFEASPIAYDAQSDGTFRFYFTDEANKNINDNNTNIVMDWWDAADGGNKMTIAAISDVDMDLIAEKLTSLDDAKVAAKNIVASYYLASSTLINNANNSIDAATTKEEIDAVIEATFPDYQTEVAGKVWHIKSGYPGYFNTQGVEKSFVYNPGGKTTWATFDANNLNEYYTITVLDNGKLNIAAHDGKYLQGVDGTMGAKATASTITLVKYADGTYNINCHNGTVHTEGHANGAGVSGNLVNWSGVGGTASSWVFVAGDKGKYNELKSNTALITYKYYFENVERSTETIEAVKGEAYPAAHVPYGVVAPVPEGTVTGDEEIQIDCTLADDYPFQYSYTGPAKWYTLTIRGNKYPTYNATTNHFDNKTTKPTELTKNDIFAFHGTPWSFVIANGAKYNDMLGCSYGDGNKLEIVDITDENLMSFQLENNDGHLVFVCMTGDDQKRSGHLNDVNGELGIWTHTNSATDGGSTLTFEPVDDELAKKLLIEYDWAAFENYINQLQAVSFGTGLGEYFFDDPIIDAFVSDIIEDFAAYLDDKDNVAPFDYEYAMDAMQDMLERMQLNMPKAGTMLRIKDADGKYMTCENANNKTVFSEEKNDKGIYCYTGSALVAYTNGFYASRYSNKPCGMSAATTEGAGTLYHIHASPLNKGKYLVSFGGDTRFMYKNADAGNYTGGPSTVNNAGYEFTLEEVETLPVTLSTIDGHNYGTFYTPVGISDLDGVKAYIATEENGKAKMSEIETIPANTAVVLYAKDADKTSANFTIGEANASTTGNILEGQVATIATVSGACTLQNNAEKGLGFYSYNGATLKGFKAYLNASEHSVKSFTLDFDMETAIRGIQEAEEKGAAMYDMSGRRILKAQKGVYIQNGKKYVK
ncbi:MAG: hypothetical protein KBT39_01055 [Bacteroidales bacterium]|nr:hypothetical protein [Bacteroidales bacterium]